MLGKVDFKVSQSYEFVRLKLDLFSSQSIALTREVLHRILCLYMPIVHFLIG